MNYIKKNYKFIICMILILVVFTIKFPYYLEFDSKNVQSLIFKGNARFLFVEF